MQLHRFKEEEMTKATDKYLITGTRILIKFQKTLKCVLLARLKLLLNTTSILNELGNVIENILTKILLSTILFQRTSM